MAKLSILIPARNEQFLARTIEDILEHKRGDTEILVGLDGEWASPGIPDHPDVKILYLAQSLGQRALTNQLARLSTAKYVMKVDAHCAFDDGFDVKMMEDMQDHWTMVPIMRNLHAFNWVCPQGHTRYQGPSGPCQECGEPTTQDVVWIPKTSPQSKSYRFDNTLHFQYHGGYMKTEGARAGIITGYKLSISKSGFSPSIIGSFADFAGSHKLACSGNCLWWRKNMAPDAVSLADVDHSGSIRANEVGLVGDELEVQRVTTGPVSTDVVNDGDFFSSAPGDGGNQPGEGETMCECFLAEVGTPTITPSINSSNPIPTSGSVIKSDVINELNSIIGGEFIYSEKTSSFHNKSVALTLVRDKRLNYSMSLQGSFFMMTRDKYWELDICDEAHGSWGQQGVEVACKTWLSGGEVMVNQKTWYAHMFRTQGGDFSFPYPLSGRQVDKARRYSRDLWLNNKWPKAIHDLQWLIDKFSPVPDWGSKKGIIFYTDNQLRLDIAHRVQKQLKRVGLPITSASLKPMPKMGKNVHLPLKRGVETYFRQIIAALEASEADIVFFCEHDVLYHPSHFDFTPTRKDKFYYNTNVWRVRQDGFAVTWEANQVAELCCYRELALAWYKNKLEETLKNGFDRSYEPGSRQRHSYEQWRSEFPNIDIRHGANLTKSKWSIDDFRDKSSCVNWQESTVDQIPGWDDLRSL